MPGHRPCCPCLPQRQSLTSRLTTVWAAAWGPSGHPDGPSCQRAGTVPGTQPQEASFCPNPLRHPGALRTGGCPSHLRSQKWGQKASAGSFWAALAPTGPGPLPRLDLWPPLPGPVRQARSPPRPRVPCPAHRPGGEHGVSPQLIPAAGKRVATCCQGPAHALCPSGDKHLCREAEPPGPGTS